MLEEEILQISSVFIMPQRSSERKMSDSLQIIILSQSSARPERLLPSRRRPDAARRPRQPLRLWVGLTGRAGFVRA